MRVDSSAISVLFEDCREDEGAIMKKLLLQISFVALVLAPLWCGVDGGGGGGSSGKKKKSKAEKGALFQEVAGVSIIG